MIRRSGWWPPSGKDGLPGSEGRQPVEPVGRRGWYPECGAGTGGTPEGFAAACHRILPQVVPASFCRHAGGDLVSLPLVAGLRVALVLDEPERYQYLTRPMVRTWGVKAGDLLQVAVKNLRDRSEGLQWKRMGLPPRQVLLCETFDGYDASRVLLLSEWASCFAHLPGRLILGMPHRDFLVVAGDADLHLVAHLRVVVADDFRQAHYPVSPQLFRIDRGVLSPAPGPDPPDCPSAMRRLH